MRISDIGEFGLIELLARQLPEPSSAVVKGIGDDAAVIKGNGSNSTIFTTDMMVEEIHFSRRFCSAYEIGWKALAVNVSDIAAMGGRPTVAVVSVAIPVDWTVEELEGLYKGLGAAARIYRVSIVGGDTVKSSQGLNINVALLGEAEPDKVVYRSGARPGDTVLVTGTLGDSAAGLALSQDPELTGPAGCCEALRERHKMPLAQALAGYNLAQARLVNSMNDISDGLASEIHEICKASGVGCRLQAESIPVSEETKILAGILGTDPLEWALFGGEDFQLVFTLAPERVAEAQQLLSSLGVASAAIGEIVPGSEVVLVKANRDKAGLEKTDQDKGVRDEAVRENANYREIILQPRGYNHFAPEKD